MKRSSRIAAALVAATLTIGGAVAPATASSAYSEPTASSQAVSDAIIGSSVLPLRIALPLVQGTPLEQPVVTGSSLAMIPLTMLASVFGKQCHLGDTRGCHA